MTRDSFGLYELKMEYGIYETLPSSSRPSSDVCGLVVGALALGLLVYFATRPPSLFSGGRRQPLRPCGECAYGRQTPEALASPPRHLSRDPQGDLSAPPGFAAFTKDAFAESDETKGFNEAFQPRSYLSSMPASWREGASAPLDDDGFARYSISRDAVQASEDLRATMRLAEMEPARQTKTVGHLSLLREAVTPIGPPNFRAQEIPFNDSQLRIEYLCETGKLPSKSC